MTIPSRRARASGHWARATGLAACAAVVTTAVAPGDALAGVARVSGSQVIYEAQPGEINHVRVGLGLLSSDELEIGDDVNVTPGPGCRPTGGAAASCSHLGGFRKLRIVLGDGDDQNSFASLLPFALEVDGGDGNDTLRSLAADSRLDGGKRT